MSQKEPITGLQEGNCCPDCGSTKVVLHMQMPVVQKFDINGKPIYEDVVNGKRIYKPSNHYLVSLYRCAIRDQYQCANYECQKCGWQSETYVP